MTARTASDQANAHHAAFGDARQPVVSSAGIKRGRRVVRSSDEEADNVGGIDQGQGSAIQSRRDYHTDGENDDLEAYESSGKEDGPKRTRLLSQVDAHLPPKGLKLKLRFNPTPSLVASTSQHAAKPKSKRSRMQDKRASTPDGDIDELEDETMEEASTHSASSASTSDDEIAGMGSGHAGTARQRAKHNAEPGEPLLHLAAEHSKKHAALTDMERASKREESARRRKLQADQKQENDKTEAINRLLKASSGRSRSKLQNVVAGEGSRDVSPLLDGQEREANVKAEDTIIKPNTFRFVNSIKGEDFTITLGVPASKTNPAWATNKPRIRLGAACAIGGCDKPRKYRSVKSFENGGCSMSHLRMYEETLH